MKLVPENVLSYFSSSKVKGMRLFSKSQNCTTILVELEDFKYVLKKYPPETAFSAIPVNEEALQFLFLNGFDALSRLLLAADQSTNFETEDGSIWVAREYLEADQSFDWTSCTWDEVHCREAGNLLAEMHARGVYVEHDLELLQVNTSVLSHTKLSFDLLLNKLESALDSLSTYIEASELEQHRNKVESSLKQFIERLADGSGEPSSLGSAENWVFAETVLNHGDIHPGNILFSDDKAVAIIDFDYANFNTPAVELGYALYMFAVKEKRREYSATTSICDQVFARAFLDSYFERLKRIENIRNYEFDSMVAILEPRIKLASLYTVFWIASLVEEFSDKTKGSIRAMDKNAPEQSIGDENISSSDNKIAINDDIDGYIGNQANLVKIAKFSLDYFFSLD